MQVLADVTSAAFITTYVAEPRWLAGQPEKSIEYEGVVKLIKLTLRQLMKGYRGYRYKIKAQPDGWYHFDLWAPGVNVRAPGRSWGPPRETEEDAERAVKKWIDDQPLRRSKGGAR